MKSKQVIHKGKHAFDCNGQNFIVDDKYQFIKQIGYGAYGVVCSVLNKKSQQLVAIKKITDTFSDLIDAKRIYKAYKYDSLEFFDFENIVSLLDSQGQEHPKIYKDIYINIDLMETDLYRVIYLKQELTDQHIQYFLYQVLRGLLYIHSSYCTQRSQTKQSTRIMILVWLVVMKTKVNFKLNKQLLDVIGHQKSSQMLLNIINQLISALGCILAELLCRLFPGKDCLDQITPTNEDVRLIENKNALTYLSIIKETQIIMEELVFSCLTIGLGFIRQDGHFQSRTAFDSLGISGTSLF